MLGAIQTSPITILVLDNPEGIEQKPKGLKEMDFFEFEPGESKKKKKKIKAKRYKI